MITKESLVCTAKQAKKLKGLGAPQQTLFAWTVATDAYGSLNLLDDNLEDGNAAFTSAESLELLPKMGKIKRFFFVLTTGLDPVLIAEKLIKHYRNGKA